MSNSTTMRSSLTLLSLCALCCWRSAGAAEFSGRFSMLGATARAEAGDWGYGETAGNVLTADQQGVRLMLEGGGEKEEWASHLRLVRTHSSGYAVAAAHSSALFRYAELGGELLDEGDGTSTTTVHYELDRLFYRRHFSRYSIALGRQPLDWGSGRFWQPLNLFGSFAPTDLDTDYKPGIDALTIGYFPSPLSSLTGVYTFAPEDEPAIRDSGAVHYRRQAGAVSELTLVAGKVSGNSAMGAAFESSWRELGWRIEAIHYQLEETHESALFWIAGLDYQFDNGTMMSAEYYDNSRGAETEAELGDMVEDELVAAGLQQQLSRRLLGLALSRDLTPLLHGSYTLLGSPVDDEGGSSNWSLLHQLNLTYSVSNESDLLLSLLLPTGKGLSELEEPRSEFGHIPSSFSLRLRFYF